MELRPIRHLLASQILSLGEALSGPTHRNRRMCLVAVATALILAVIVWQASAGIGTQPVIQRATAAW
ncbi:MAG: hypothetical protein WA973_06360 [Mesorhizobium sp.]